MSMTLDEMLALLPDNTTGEIDAADLRAIVTDLYDAAHTQGVAYTFEWTDDQTPPNGKLSLNQGWQTFSTTMNLSETSADGQVLTFGTIDASRVRIVLHPATGGTLKLDTTGPSTDLGGYRSVPVQVLEITGTSPVNNESMSTAFVVLP